MTQITITEALAEVKTIGRRVEKKRETIFSYFYRQEPLKDPLEKEGGSEELVSRELQAVRDLQERLITIRAAIAAANATTMLTVTGVTRTLADWLTWRREIAGEQQKFFASARQRLNTVRQEAHRTGHVIVGAGEGGEARPGDIVVNVSEKFIAEGIDVLEDVLGTLDGALSLKNATTLIDLP